jgi:protein SCO1/2
MNMFSRTFLSALTLMLAGVVGPTASVSLANDGVAAIDPHAHHHMVMPETIRRVVQYTVPDVKLVRDDGKTVSLPKELDDGRPVVVSFIFTTCAAICPVISHTLAQLQDKLGADRDRVHLVSISIDPEQDTPERLAAYGKKYNAGPEWHHYTGTVAASLTAQKAFDVYRGDKMEHNPVTLLRAAPGEPWVRIEGFATANELVGEVRKMLAAGGTAGKEIHGANP